MNNEIRKYIGGGGVYLSAHGDNGYFVPYTDKQLEDMTYEGPMDEYLAKEYLADEAPFKADDVLIDCGAFVGAFCVTALRRGVKKIYAFEPHKTNVDYLKRNLNHYNVMGAVEVVEKVAYNQNGTAFLNLSTKSYFNSLLPVSVANGSSFISEEAPATTLADFIKEKELDVSKLVVKMCVNGAEDRILAGLNGINPRMVIIAERNEKIQEEIVSHMKSRGYTTYVTKGAVVSVLAK